MLKDHKALELDKILLQLANETTCPDAAELAQKIEPDTDIRHVERLLQETDDAFVLMAKYGAPSFYGMTNVTNALRRAEAGGVLNLAELLSVAATLRAIRSVSDWRKKSESVKTALDYRFETLQPNKFIEDRISMTVVSEEEVADTASVALAAIRRKIRAASLRVREQLDKMIRSQTYQKYLQEAIVTQRGGRYVVPVKAEFRNEVKGLIHDSSGSGATVFIEPIGVVEANNEIRVLRSDEKDEIDRILTELSREIGEFADSIIQSYRAAVELNLIFAKGQLAYKMKATVPKLNQEGRIAIKSARHPLIDKNKVVPTDLYLGSDFDALIVTGPNTGGKTVSLKTAGLLTLMTMCGLMIPAADGSEVSIFDHVLADIGDEQSIEQSLSTFSAHMTNIIRILNIADDKSLHYPSKLLISCDMLGGFLSAPVQEVGITKNEDGTIGFQLIGFEFQGVNMGDIYVDHITIDSDGNIYKEDVIRIFGDAGANLEDLSITLQGQLKDGELKCDLDILWLSTIPIKVAVYPLTIPYVDTQGISSLNVAAVQEGLTNPNCIIYTDEGTAVAEDTENVVVGTSCTKLNLNKIYDISIPYAFTATEASLARSFATGWHSICLPFATTPETLGAEQAQAFTAFDGNTLTFEKVTAMEANVPYLIYFAKETENISLQNIDAAVTVPQSVTHGNVTFTGNYEASRSMEGLYGVAEKDGAQYIMRGGAGSTLGSTGAYFTVSGSEVNFLQLRLDGIETSISGVQTGQDGQAFDIYTLSGIKVRSQAATTDGLPKGIYLINGKKHIVK